MKANFSKTSAGLLATLFSLAALCPPVAMLHAFTSDEAGSRAQPHLLPGIVPKGFIQNLGQVRHASVKFTLRESGIAAHFTDRGFVLWNGGHTTATQDGIARNVPVVPRWSLVGGTPVEPVGGETFAHTASFFRGNDQTKWRTNVPAYRNLRYPGILKGVEMRIEAREHGFEYTFHVQPQAKPDLRFRYDGITGLEKSPAGDLIVRTDTGYFTESRPVSFQFIDGVRREVASAFELVSAHEYRITLGAYDPRHELVIDPVLDWSTFLGGSSSVNLRDVKVDPSGNIYVSGTTSAPDLPDTAGFSTGPGAGTVGDVVVAKFDPSGTALLWLGYLGGAATSDEEVAIGNSLALDSIGNPIIVGFTESPDFPVTGGPLHAGGFDVFITKLSHDGSAILKSSLFGGVSGDYASGIALDAVGNILVTGFTRSADFPATVGAFDSTLGGTQDAFVMKLDSAGILQWSSYLGGANGEERGAAIVTDANGDVLISGDTGSADFPATAGAFDTTLGGSNDAFVAKIRADGSAVLWATFLGGSGAEHDLTAPFSPVIYHRGDLALDSAGNIVVGGQTLSEDFPVTSGAFQTTRAGDMDGYVAKLTPNGASLLWATYLGGSGGNQYQEIIWGISLNPWDEVFVIGRTDSPNFPVTPDALLTSYQGGTQDGFLTKLSANGSSLLYSTFLGGSQNRDVTLGLAYDSGNVLVSGWAASASYPITAGAYQTGCSSCAVGSADGVVLKFLDTFIVHDGFESGNYTGGRGDWSGGWTASGDTSIQTAAGPHSGSRHVRLRRGTGLLSRVFTVPPGSTSLKLGFWSKVSSFESTDNAVVRVTPTGGSPVTLITYTAADGDNTYRYDEFDLSSMISAASIQITFDANMSAIDDQWYLDDIRVTGTFVAPPPPANPLHSGDLDGTTATSGKNSWKATVVVTMHDGYEQPVQGATVSIAWSGGASGTASATTDANGRCTFVSGNISKLSPNATLTITNATHSTLTYSAAANHDPDGDSTGSTITVIKP